MKCKSPKKEIVIGNTIEKIIYNVCKNNLVNDLLADTATSKLYLEFKTGSKKFYKDQKEFRQFIQDSLMSRIYLIHKIITLKNGSQGKIFKTYYLVDNNFNIFEFTKTPLIYDSLIACNKSKLICIGQFEEVPIELKIKSDYIVLFKNKYEKNQPIIVDSEILRHRKLEIEVLIGTHSENYMRFID